MNIMQGYIEISPLRAGLMVLVAVLVYIVYFIACHLRFFFFPRKEQYPERFPFESTLNLLFNDHRIMDYLWDLVKETEKKKNKLNKSFIVNTVGIHHIAVTNNIDNIEYILKTKYENYGKAGASFKPKFQDLLGDGIFNADGHQWYAHRKTTALIFRLNRFKTSVLDAFNEDMDQCTAWIRERKGNPFDMHFLLHRCTLQSIGRIAFGLDLGTIFNERVPFAEDFDYCTWSVNQSMSNPLWLFTRYCTPGGWKYFFCIWRINQFAKEIIQDRRARLAKGEDIADMNDLLSLYLDKGTVNEANPSGEDTFLDPNDHTLRDVILNMVIAGRDTTAQALSWAFYRLVLEPGMQDRVYQEVSSIAKSADTLTYEQLLEMKFVDAFCMEVLRLHPSVPKVGKNVLQDDILPDGLSVYKNDIVTFLPWVMGRDKDLWGENAEQFQPDRFLDKPKPSPFVFSAFQAGPRTCLGQNFAMLEMKCVLARLVLSFEFAFAQDPKDITYDNSLTLPMKGGMKLKATAR
jgi:cytochrome P450